MIADQAVRERRAGVRLNGMILVSLLFHCVALALLFFSPSFPSPKLTFGPVYTVSLVSSPATALEQKKSSSSALMKELMKAERPEAVLKKQVEPAQAIPIRSLETPKRQDLDVEKAKIERAKEDIRKKVASTAAAGKQPAAKDVPERPATTETTGKPDKTEKGEKRAGGASQPGDAEMDAQMRSYYASIWSRIKGVWALPQGILPGEVLETVIDVTILRSGAVAEVTFEKKSGNRYFDESALKAVRKASPLPPLPAWISDSSIAVGIRFHSLQMNQ
jgi:colicin import membrane protein